MLLDYSVLYRNLFRAEMREWIVHEHFPDLHRPADVWWLHWAPVVLPRWLLETSFLHQLHTAHTRIYIKSRRQACQIQSKYSSWNRQLPKMLTMDAALSTKDSTKFQSTWLPPCLVWSFLGFPGFGSRNPDPDRRPSYPPNRRIHPTPQRVLDPR